jgi:hypothetical protein
VILNNKHRELSRLVAEWNLFDKASEKVRSTVSSRFGRRLVNEVLRPAIKNAENELILIHHRFLHRFPTGEHSFAHGSTMGSDIVSTVVVGRIQRPVIKYQKATERISGIGRGAIKLRFAQSFSVPVVWSEWLETLYAKDSNTKYFSVTSKKSEGSNTAKAEFVDVSNLGCHLFRLYYHDNDWATEDEIVIGDESVKVWLDIHSSPRVLDQLKERRK